MDLKSFLKKTFGKDLFGLNDDDLLKERIKTEKTVENISEDIQGLQEQIQRLLLESKGKPDTIKMLNVQKIKTLRIESSAKQQEASRELQLLQIILLVEAMKEREKNKQKSHLVDQILNTDVDHLNKVLMDTNVLKAFEEGKVDEVKQRLSAIFAKEDVLVDPESQDLLKTIDDLEKVDQESAIHLAMEKSKELAQYTTKQKQNVPETEK